METSQAEAILELLPQHAELPEPVLTFNVSYNKRVLNLKLLRQASDIVLNVNKRIVSVQDQAVSLTPLACGVNQTKA